ncbi:hypothetical protein E3N88_30451 [Mikania micrantha]|uniref:DUF8039 domain-containing protein n=1 Tax=Mikania micrantha TaxID=192012 RepID=A0A5N6MNV5_9ASTR|nr:hypothetical protein E3N88_30451 [Mikania micrantha]
METEVAIQHPLVADDFNNDLIEYESEGYSDDELDGNQNSDRNLVKRGITRLSKFRICYGKPGGIKLRVTFDALHRITGPNRAFFCSFLGDLVREHVGLKILSWKVGSESKDKLWEEIKRYFDVDETVRKLVMHRLGELLRNFRRKLRQTYILPNQNTPSKLNEVPKKYSAIVKESEWVAFVNHTSTEEYQGKSVATKWRVPSVFIIIQWDEVDTADAMTVVFGKEKGVYARGVGSGVTYKKYFNLLKKKQASDERLALLQSQLDNERRERQEKEAVIMNLSNEVAQTEGMITQLMSQLAAQGVKLPLLSTQVTTSNVDVNPKNSSTDQEGRSPLNEVGCKKDASNQKSNGVAPSENEMDTTEIHNSVGSHNRPESLPLTPQEYKCSLWHIKRSTIIAKGIVYKSDGKQMLHGNRLPNDCYKVSIDESLVDAACIPDAQINPFKTVKDALGTFVAWPKNQVIFHEKVTPPTSITNVVENKTSPKLQKKRKFVSRDYMLKQAKTKLKSQKSLY